jgi:hypothetical protein
MDSTLSGSAVRQADEIELSCLTSDPSIRYFSVNVARSWRVDDLKDVIKKKLENALVGIDANKLDIWKVSVSS